MAEDPLSPSIDNPIELDQYALSTVVYTERADGQILLLKRAEGSALAGQYFPPGGIVDPGEDPWAAAERELLEETGLRPSGPLSMVGCYPMFVYGQKMLQLSFRCQVTGEAALSHEHTDFMWAAPADVVAFLRPEVRAQIADGNPQVAEILESIAQDFGRYLAIVS